MLDKYGLSFLQPAKLIISRRWFLLLALGLAACGGANAPTLPAPPPPPETTVAGPAQTTPSEVAATVVPPSPTAPPTDVPPEPATDTPPPPPATAPPPLDLAVDAADVFLFPVPAIYEGDVVTVQFVAQLPDHLRLDQVPVSIAIDGDVIVNGTLSRYNLGGEAIGQYAWVWPTTDQAGLHTLQIALDPDDLLQVGDENPDNNTVVLSFAVEAAGARPANAVDARWITRETGCCRVHVVSGTAADRDLATLLNDVETAVQQARNRLEVTQTDKLDVYLIDRVIGQGGYAQADMVISYLDRDYAGGGLYEVILHEAVHLLDRSIARSRTPFLAEGVAVWATGGHYKPEPLQERVAALVEIGRYVPLETLIDNFYPTQHEIGYLEAAGFVSYLIDRYGWSAVRAFYADAEPTPDAQDTAIVDRQLQAHFGQSLAQLEQEWLASLADRRVDREVVADLEATLRFYQVMRHYQLHYDPTAHFLRAWLPAPDEARRRGLTADFTRHVIDPIATTFELLLVSADEALLAGDYNRLHVLLDSVEDGVAQGGTFIDPLAGSYLDIVTTLSAEGYEVLGIDLAGNRAEVLVYEPGAVAFSRATVVLNGQGWALLN